MRCCTVVTRKEGNMILKVGAFFIGGGELKEGGQRERTDEYTED